MVFWGSAIVDALGSGPLCSKHGGPTDVRDMVLIYASKRGVVVAMGRSGKSQYLTA